MSFTAKSQFTGLTGNVNAAQAQQQGQTGQSKPHSDAPLPNFPVPSQNQQLGNANAGNHPLPSLASVNMTPMNRQQLQQQQQQYANLQQTLLLQQQQQYLQQLQAAGSEPLALSRVMSEYQKTVQQQQANGNVNATLSQTQQLQQLVQRQTAPQQLAGNASAAILNMMVQVAAQQQKPFQQQQVPLPSNTTITPISRPNTLPSQSAQNFQKSPSAPQHKHPLNKPAVPNTLARRNPPPAASSNASNAFVSTPSSVLPAVPLPPKAPQLSVPSSASGLNVTTGKSSGNVAPSAVSKPTPPAGGSPVKPALSISSSTTVSVNSSVSISSSNSSTQSLSINLTSTQISTTLSPKPSVNSSTISPNNLNMPTTPQKTSPKVIGATSPRTKQTPRKSSNPIKATLSPNADPSASKSPEKASPITPPKADSTVKPKTEEEVNPEKVVASPTKTPSSNASPAKPEPKLVKVNESKPLVKLAKPVVPGVSSSNTVVTATSTAAKPSAATPAATTSPASKKTSPVQKTPAKKEKAQPKAKSAEIATPAKASQENAVDKKAKRNRLKTIPFQSPLPEIELISKLSASEANNTPKSAEDKLILFYRNEFLAVRNSEGGFFLCQALQNVYKSSPKIRIRWLSEEKSNPNIYNSDFYDHTDIECVLTTVSLEKTGKVKYELTETEKSRIENILKKAIDVEKGVLPRPDVTEEHPDGLDLSLYKDESQIEKKTPAKRKASGLVKKDKKSKDDDDISETESDEDNQPLKKKGTPANSKKPIVVATSAKKGSSKLSSVETPSMSSSQVKGRAERSQRRSEIAIAANSKDTVSATPVKETVAAAKRKLNNTISETPVKEKTNEKPTSPPAKAAKLTPKSAPAKSRVVEKDSEPIKTSPVNKPAASQDSASTKDAFAVTVDATKEKDVPKESAVKDVAVKEGTAKGDDSKEDASIEKDIKEDANGNDTSAANSRAGRSSRRTQV